MENEMVCSNGILKCPVCGSQCIHHFRVEIFDRREDENYGTLTIVDNAPPENIKNLKLGTTLKDNPSPRRHGMKIYFSCEECPQILILDIIQHKGSTYIEWEGQENR